MSVGLTFDTAAVISLDRRKQKMLNVFNAATDDGVPITVPAVVVAEWWREAGDWCRHILKSVTVEPMDAGLGRAAGEALAKLGDRLAPPSCPAKECPIRDQIYFPNKRTIDAIVVASAARRGDIIYTADFDDLLPLLEFFKSVKRLERVSGP